MTARWRPAATAWSRCVMGGFMSLSLSDPPVLNSSADATAVHAGSSPNGLPVAPPIFAFAAWYSLAWLVVANTVGVQLAALLLFPRINGALGEWTYGRWMPVHINLQLYGWCSLPLVGFLFKAYGADRAGIAQWCRPILWIWSAALATGALSWLTGHSGGKLFLDWTGYARVLFPLAQISLWLLLAVSSFHNWHSATNAT